jgi:hypothetical protein
MDAVRPRSSVQQRWRLRQEDIPMRGERVILREELIDPEALY